MILLVIDMQKGIVNEELYAFDTFIERTTKLIDVARKQKIEVIYFQHDDGVGSGFSIGDLDFEIANQVAPKKDEKIFVKTISSCFGNKEFAEYMEKQVDKRLMIIGLQTNYCIDATVKSAFEKGYQVFIPDKTNSTFVNKFMNAETTYRYYNEEIWPSGLAKCISFKDAIKMLKDIQCK